MNRNIASKIPILARVVGAPTMPKPATSKGPGPVPSNAATDEQRAAFIKVGARRSTETGGSMLQRAEQAANEQGLTINVGANPLAGI